MIGFWNIRGGVTTLFLALVVRFFPSINYPTCYTERADILVDVVISWETETYTTPGTYRIVYNGDSKAPITGTISAFQGTSSQFTVS
jgi:hypothetical protein